MIIDTVGFIRKLPHHLVASFRSTMEEAVAADLVLHVIDASHPQFEEQREVGQEVLNDLGVDPATVVEVYNKVDRIDDTSARPPQPVRDGLGAHRRGHRDLIDVIRGRERAGGEMMQLEVPHDESRVAARLHEVAEVYEQTVTDRGTIFRAWVPHHAVHLFQAYSAERLLETAEAK